MFPVSDLFNQIETILQNWYLRIYFNINEMLCTKKKLQFTDVVILQTQTNDVAAIECTMIT